MSNVNEFEMMQENAHEPEVEARPGVPVEENVPNAAGAKAPECEFTPRVFKLGKGILTEAQYELLGSLGEEPQEYLQIVESLRQDLEPRRGLETHLVDQMGETFWQMRRVQNMRDGLALKSIQRKVQGETMVAAIEASKVLDALEPFERLKEALSRQIQGPTAAEVDEFVKTRTGELSPSMQKFIILLKSLKEPMEETERKAALRQARKDLIPLMETYETLAWQYTRRSQRVQSSANLAALMAPEDQNSVHLQRLQDSCLQRMWRLINAFGKVRQGILQKKEIKKIRTKPECV